MARADQDSQTGYALYRQYTYIRLSMATFDTIFEKSISNRRGMNED